MLPDMNTPLNPPAAPFASASNSGSASEASLASPPPGPAGAPGAPPVSLSVNYLPTKFSSTLLSPVNPRKRKGKGIDPVLPKRGGGVEAFRTGEARMPGQDDDDDDDGPVFGAKGGKPSRRLRWNKFKWTLFICNIFVRAPFFSFFKGQSGLCPLYRCHVSHVVAVFHHHHHHYSTTCT